MNSENLSTKLDPMGDYVAELQLHMTLQARNLTPSLSCSSLANSSQQLVHESQAAVEKIISRNVKGE